MAHPLNNTDYMAWAEQVDSKLYQKTGLDLILWPAAPIASWWEQGLSADAAVDMLLAQERPDERPSEGPQSPSPSPYADEPGPDTFDMMQESILWPWLDDPSCDY